MTSKGYPQQWMTELKSKNDIVSVVSRYVHLQQKGKSFWGCCPFHNEKTPSFSVNPEGNFFHCFGCKEGGDAISFVEKIESVDFTKAIELLASWSGMTVPTLEGNDEIVLKAKKKEVILRILEETKNFFIKNLDKPQAKTALEYIARRKLTKFDLDKFQIGASLDWNSLIVFLKSKGYTLEEMKDAGVIEIKDGHSYDVMAERLTFPIFNSYGDCIAFSARILVPSDFAKYKNTADTLAFNKSNSIFGINLIKKLKAEKGIKNIIIVEGQMDVIAMHQAGFVNSVACMGTALTQEHARELKRFTDNILVCFDGDLAGRKATLRSLDILKNAGLNVKVVSIDEGGKDPDEFIKARGVEAMQKLLDEAVPATDYKIISLSKEFDLSESSERAKFADKAMEIINSLNSSANQDIYLGLIKQYSNIPMDILRKDLDRNIRISTDYIKNDHENMLTNDSRTNSINFILAANLHNQPYAIIPENFDRFLQSNEERIIYDYILDCKNKNVKPVVGTIFELLEGQDTTIAKELVGYEFNFDNFSGEKHFDACMWTIVESEMKLLQQELLKKFNETKDIDERKIYLEKINKIAQNLMRKNWRDS
ncbi:MAG: DNA primase [Clostridia bacterium]